MSAQHLLPEPEPQKLLTTSLPASNDATKAQPQSEPKLEAETESKFMTWQNWALKRWESLKTRDRWIMAAMAGCLVLAVVGLWLSSSNASTDKKEVITNVKVVHAQRSSIMSEVSAKGKIFPYRQETLSTKVSGQILHMPALLDKTVRIGDEVAVLESNQLSAQRDEAKTALVKARIDENLMNSSSSETEDSDVRALWDARVSYDNARSKYDRYQSLYKRGSITKKELDGAQLDMVVASNNLKLVERSDQLREIHTSIQNLTAAKTNLKEAEQQLADLNQQLGNTRIRAPFSGIVTEQFQHQGDFATTEAKLLTIADFSEVIVKATFAKVDASQLHNGDAVTVYAEDMSGTGIPGTISAIITPSKSDDTVEISVNLKNENGQLQGNHAARIVLAPQKADDVIVLPATAVVFTDISRNSGKVMVIDDKSTVHAREVKIGIHTPQRVAIMSGLREGETVLLNGEANLAEGAKVAIGKN